MKVVSLCSGYGGLELALDALFPGGVAPRPAVVLLPHTDRSGHGVGQVRVRGGGLAC